MFREPRRPYIGDHRLQPLELADRVLARLPPSDRQELELRLMPSLADDSDPIPALEPYLTPQERDQFLPPVVPCAVPTHCACGGTYLLAGSESVCEWCGSLGPPPPASCSAFGPDARPQHRHCVYRRTAHLRGYLDQIQARSCIRLEPRLLDAATEEVRKHRTPPSDITPRLLRTLLKPYRLSRHYYSLPRVAIELGGPPPPQIPPDIEAKVIASFRKVEEAFEATKDRKNILGMAFVVSQLLRVHGCDPSPWAVSHLRTRRPQLDQDRRWKVICEMTGIPYLGL